MKSGMGLIYSNTWFLLLTRYVWVGKDHALAHLLIEHRVRPGRRHIPKASLLPRKLMKYRYQEDREIEVEGEQNKIDSVSNAEQHVIRGEKNGK